MGGVVRPKTDGEHDERAECQANGTQPPPSADVWKTGQDEDEVDVAEAADDEGDAKENEEELQAHLHHDVELIFCKIQVAGEGRRGRAVGGGVVVTVCAFAVLGVGDDVDDAEIQRGHHPESDTGKDSVARPAAQGVPEREGDPQVALHAHSREEQRAVVDGDVEQEPSEGTEGEGQQPDHVIGGLLHFEWQEGQEDEVGDGEVEQQDIYGGRLATHLPAEGAECQDVGGDPHQKGEDVDRKQQMTVQHGGGSQRGQTLRHWMQEKNTELGLDDSTTTT